MSTERPALPKAPEPSRVFFDPWNSASTGHQRAENRLSGSTSWRDSRQYKLTHQWGDSSGHGGQKHLSDLVGAGSENFGKDGRKENGDWEKGAPGLRPTGWQDIRGLLGTSKKRRSESAEPEPEFKKQRVESQSTLSSETSNVSGSMSTDDPVTSNTTTSAESQHGSVQSGQPPQIFRGLTMFLNGSTMPLISDHKLKQLFVQYGGNASISLGRRTVTHVILGEAGNGGGGLASTKIQKENATVRGKGVKYVSCRWVLDSIKQGVRQPESRYMIRNAEHKLGGSGQRSVATLFRAKSG